jgi:hypothetical protein
MNTEEEEFNRIEREAKQRMEAVHSTVTRYESETTMSEYIKGFNDGYDFVLTQIERHPEMTTVELLAYLRWEDVEHKSQVNNRGIATG